MAGAIENRVPIVLHPGNSAQGENGKTDSTKNVDFEEAGEQSSKDESCQGRHEYIGMGYARHGFPVLTPISLWCSRPSQSDVKGCRGQKNRSNNECEPANFCQYLESA